jgi:hypothetical protein
VNSRAAASVVNKMATMQTWRFISGPQDLLISHPATFSCGGFVKETIYIRPLPTTLADLKTRITTAVNSVTQDILLRVWDEFSYRLDVIRAAGGGHTEHL